MYAASSLYVCFLLILLQLISLQAKSTQPCPSLLKDTLQIVEDMNLLYIRQISKKLQVHIVDCDMENDDVCVILDVIITDIIKLHLVRICLLHACQFSLVLCFSKCQSYISKLHLCHYNCYPRQLINLIQLALPSNPFMHASLRHRKVGLEFVISSLSSNLKHHQCIILTSGANVSNDCKSTKGSKTCREISFSQKMLNIEIPAFLQRNVNV